MDIQLPADQLTADLIAIPSLSGKESAALQFLEQSFERLGWEFERVPVGPENYNLFVTFGAVHVSTT